MDTYENKPVQQPDAPAPQNESYTPSQPYYQYGGYQAPYYQYPPVEPAPQPKEKKGGKAWKVILSIVVVLAIVITCCFFTAASVNSYW